MLKFKITNTSATSEKGPRNIFLIEVGKRIDPGDVAYANKIDPGTRLLEDAGALKIEEGNYPRRSSLTPDEEARLAAASPTRSPSRSVMVDVEALRAARKGTTTTPPPTGEPPTGESEPNVPSPKSSSWDPTDPEWDAGKPNSGGQASDEPSSDRNSDDPKGAGSSKKGKGRS